MNAGYRLILNLSFQLCIFLNAHPISGQETNSSARAFVQSERNELLSGATVTATHEPTQNVYQTLIRDDGYFYFSNLKPGGPYTLVISYTGYEVLKKTSLYLNFNAFGSFVDQQNGQPVEFLLKENQKSLKEIIVAASRYSNLNIGTTTNITASLLASMPTISRNLQDFVRLVPQSKVNGDGMMSLAGQNNKFNAFFIDGVNNNDLLGVATNGISGGQSGSPPVSIDALEEMTVLLAPYDVQYGHFTGGSINAVTKSGTNKLSLAAWYYFRNESMAGRSLSPIEVNGSPGHFEHPRLTDFFNQTIGFSVGGPLVRNKVFYFMLAERQMDQRPQLYDFKTYRGSSSGYKFYDLTDTLQKKYNYDPGSFLEFEEKLHVIRTLFKVDWHLSDKNKVTISYRYNNGNRETQNSANSNTLIRFQNNAYRLPVTTHAASIEWNRFGKKNRDNRFLFSLLHQKEGRNSFGKDFPAITIFDGSGTLILGSNATAQINNFKATDLSILDVFTFFTGRHHFSTGFDLKLSSLYDLFIPNYFGTYQFRSLEDFLSNKFPSRFLHSFQLADNLTNSDLDPGATYKTFRQGYFINDEIQLSDKFRLNFGIRLDANSFLTDPFKDSFFNDTAAPVISQYYDLEGAKTGERIKTIWQVSPRFGFSYKLPEKSIVIRGGAGVFTGHLINFWMSDKFRPAYGSLDINPRLYSLKFNPDPYNQPDFQSLGIDQSKAKGDLTVLSDQYKFPSVFRTSVSMEKRLKGNWIISIETMLSKNIREAKYTNVNLIPPELQSVAPDSRNIYSLDPFPGSIPITADGKNPYSSIILQSNNNGKKGYAYSFTGMINKSLNKNMTVHGSYTLCRSVSLFEPTGNAGPVFEQWRQSETVNGKNFTTLSNSDFGYGHKISVLLEKYFTYDKGKTSTLISLFFNGMSGSPYSYVYTGSLINDNGVNNNFDLIYIPTQSELTKMKFVAITINGLTYSGEQQKFMYEQFIQKDAYLKKHRGRFAERNGARLPFTRTLDLQLQQWFHIKAGKSNLHLNISYTVFNFANMLNRKWGRIYFMSFDNVPIVKVAGLDNSNDLVPQYQFFPLKGDPYSIQPSTAPGSSARWISQLGCKIQLD